MTNGIDQVEKQFKENMAAINENIATYTKSAQSIALELTDYSRKNFEDAVKAFEKSMSAKSLDKYFEVQTNYAKMAYDAYAEQLNKLSKLYAEHMSQSMTVPFAGFPK